MEERQLEYAPQSVVVCGLIVKKSDSKMGYNKFDSKMGYKQVSSDY